MKRRGFKLLLALGAACAVPTAGNAAILVTVAQSGTDVVATLTGSLNLTGLTALSPVFGLSKAVRGTTGYIGLGTATTTTGYTGVTGPGVFGPGTTFTVSSSNAGDGFGLEAFSGAQTLFLAPNYISGAQLGGSSTFAGTTIATLGLAVGQHVFQTPADTVTIRIGAAAAPVPEPAAWGLMVLGFGLSGAALRSSRRRTVVTQA